MFKKFEEDIKFIEQIFEPNEQIRAKQCFTFFGCDKFAYLSGKCYHNTSFVSIPYFQTLKATQTIDVRVIGQKIMPMVSGCSHNKVKAQLFPIPELV